MRNATKVVIVGARGQLGTDCYLVFRAHYAVAAFDLPELDICSQDSIREVLDSIQPDVVVNCAAFTQVDLCETEREAAFNVNVAGVHNLAACAREAGSFLVHVSTDYVFDGDLDHARAYVEDDAPRPATYYGLTKLQGEQAIQGTTDQYAILRTAWLYGITGRNFLKTILKRALHNPGTPLRVVDDQRGCPTWAYRLAVQIVKLVDERRTGVFHAVAHGSTSWYGFAKTFLERMAVPHVIESCTSEEYKTSAQRPLNSVLDNARLRAMELDIMRDWESDLIEFTGRYRDRLLQEARLLQA